jgi:uncharacterized protein YchJ
MCSWSSFRRRRLFPLTTERRALKHQDEIASSNCVDNIRLSPKEASVSTHLLRKTRFNARITRLHWILHTTIQLSKSEDTGPCEIWEEPLQTSWKRLSVYKHLSPRRRVSTSVSDIHKTTAAWTRERAGLLRATWPKPKSTEKVKRTELRNDQKA